MPKCVKKRRKNRTICIGDLRDKITLQRRTIQAPAGGVDFTEKFDNDTIVYASIETREGLEAFDGTNVSTVITHEFWIRYIAGVTEQTWIEFDGRKFDIVRVENVDERKQYLKILARERGEESVRINRI